jgi:hypothetical protein
MAVPADLLDQSMPDLELPPKMITFFVVTSYKGDKRLPMCICKKPVLPKHVKDEASVL